MMKRLLVILASSALFVGQAGAGTIHVAVLGAPGNPAWNTEVQTKLQGTGLFTTVDAFDLHTTTPSLAVLMTYGAVLIYTDIGDLHDPVALGDNLADYVDLGGGVVVSTFANASLPFAGRFATDNYWGIQPDWQTQNKPLTLGTVHEPLSPLMAGVSTFDGGESSFMSTGTLHPSATVVAEWSDGNPLVVRRMVGTTRRVDLNFFPPSDDSRSDFWKANTDGELLMANALVFVTVAGPVSVETISWAGVKASYR